MMKRMLACAMLALVLAALFAPAALAAAPAPVGKDDFVVRIGKTDFDMLVHSFDVALWSSGKKMVKNNDDTRNATDYQLKAKEATFYVNDGEDFARHAFFTKKGKTARGVKIGSTLSALLAAYPATDDVWDDGKVTYYHYQAPNAPASLPATVDLDSGRPDYFYKLIISVNNKTNKVISISINAWYE